MSVRSKALPVLSLLLAAGGLAACGGSGGSSGNGDYVNGKTFTLVTAVDPGNMDPQASYAVLGVVPFAYDTLVAVGPDGTIQSNLASSWKVSGTTVTFELRDDVTCSDGSAFDAQTVVDNIDYVADIKNASPIRGVYLPADVSASASGSTVTVSLAAPDPFVLEGFANLPMICASGLKDRGSLKAASAGTGPYTLTEAVPGDHYTFAVRKDYAWGPDGAKTSATGTPAKVVVQVVANEATAANLVLSGQGNTALIAGPDGARLKDAGVESIPSQVNYAGQTYNQDPARTTSDRVVRVALTQALDLAELQKVTTAGAGVPATGVAVYAPGVCGGNTVKGNVPEHDPEAAAAALKADGWVEGEDGILAKDGEKLALTFVYTNMGPSDAAAAELAVAAWEEIGAKITTKVVAGAERTATLYESGDWDIAWAAPSVPNPRLLIPFFSGPHPSDGGANFASIANADYDAHAKAAMTKVGNDGCSDWEAAEAALFQAADYVPIANKIALTFHKGAEIGQLNDDIMPVPTSIRMLG